MPQTFLPKAPGDVSATPRCALLSHWLAKAVFLVSDSQLAALAALQLEGEAAKATGCCVGGKITLYDSGSLLAASLERWGGAGGLLAAHADRDAKAAVKVGAKHGPEEEKLWKPKATARTQQQRAARVATLEIATLVPFYSLTQPCCFFRQRSATLRT